MQSECTEHPAPTFGAMVPIQVIRQVEYGVRPPHTSLTLKSPPADVPLIIVMKRSSGEDVGPNVKPLAEAVPPNAMCPRRQPPSEVPSCWIRSRVPTYGGTSNAQSLVTERVMKPQSPATFSTPGTVVVVVVAAAWAGRQRKLMRSWSLRRTMVLLR